VTFHFVKVSVEIQVPYSLDNVQLRKWTVVLAWRSDTHSQQLLSKLPGCKFLGPWIMPVSSSVFVLGQVNGEERYCSNQILQTEEFGGVFLCCMFEIPVCCKFC